MAFLRFIAVRLVSSLATLLMISFIVFSLMELVPGNCAERYIAYKNTQGQTITEADIRAMEVTMGLDRPFVERWAGWVWGVFAEGDFGTSCLIRADVATIVGDKFWLSLAICLGALALAYLIAVPVGILSARVRGGWADSILRFASYLGLALPNFLLALMILLSATVFWKTDLTGLFSAEFREAPWSWDKFVDMLSHAWVPIVILGWSATAFALQTVRALVSDELDKLYVTAAMARGVAGRRLLWRYPARHALGPLVNSVGFDLNRVFNELPIVAVVLILTDAGKLLFDALARSNDQELAGAIIFMLTASIVGLNFLTDILLAVIDPRVRKGLFK
ncbi:ABC transporter permease [Albimonas pacifica]|uniref:Peptide/nickel transport system permease protein n=1 Tax=Albimonas pacifica TaxID=1114924 RepID=A0A1I3HRZ9_9RHOB|nr:ABC transporter permease [Albimonas pacifica]SFI38548.1 peptide/nickel transport system permease protein [Albimonas pacifica]